MTLWNEIARALRQVDRGLSTRVLEWPVEAVVHAGLCGSDDFAQSLGVQGRGEWVAGRNGLADSTRIAENVPQAGVEIKITAKENAANYKCEKGCIYQLEHLAHQGDLVIVTTTTRAQRDGGIWPHTARVITLAELADVMDRSDPPTDEKLVRAIFGLRVEDE